jgi:hypothetical protein
MLPPLDSVERSLAPYAHWGLLVLAQHSTPIPPTPNKRMVRFTSHADVPPWNYVNPRMPPPNPPREAPLRLRKRKGDRKGAGTGDKAPAEQRPGKNFEHSDASAGPHPPPARPTLGGAFSNYSFVSIFSSDRSSSTFDRFLSTFDRYSPSNSVDGSGALSRTVDGKLDRRGVTEGVWWAPRELKAMKLINLVEWRHEVASGGWARAPDEVKARKMIEWKDLGGIAMLTKPPFEPALFEKPMETQHRRRWRRAGGARRRSTRCTATRTASAKPASGTGSGARSPR